MTIPQAVPLLKQLLRRDRLKVKSSRKVKNEPLWWKKRQHTEKKFPRQQEEHRASALFIFCTEHSFYGTMCSYECR